MRFWKKIRGITGGRNSLGFRLSVVGMAIIAVLGLLWSLINAYFLSQYQHAAGIRKLAGVVRVDLFNMRAAERDILLSDVRQPQFYAADDTADLTKQKEAAQALSAAATTLIAAAPRDISESAQSLRDMSEHHQTSFLDLVRAYHQMGFRDLGIQGNLQKATQDAQQIISGLGSTTLMMDLLQLRTDEKDYLLNAAAGGGGAEELAVLHDINVLRTAAQAAPAAATAAALLASIQRYEAAFQSYLPLQAQVLKLEAQESGHGMEAVVDQVESSAISKSDAATQSLQYEGFAVLIGVIIGVIVFFLYSRSISGPILKLRNAALEIGKGRLDTRVDIPSKDEIGLLATTFNQMVADFQNATRQIREAVAVLAASAAGILASTTDVASGASQTASAVTETTTTVEEVRQTAQLSSQKASVVAENAQQSADVAQAGKRSLDESAASMNRIRNQMGSIADSIVRLSEQSHAIGEIIASVGDLAEQSNLLAVNASIEAAKAGEHGKGFAVVAQEVRSLAEQSKQATAQVRTILNDIQKATSAAILATEQGNKVVEAGMMQFSQAESAIRMLADSIAGSAQAAMQIAASSQQQLIGTDQVAQAMHSINQASIQNVAAMKELETAAHNLHDLGQTLMRSVERYAA